MVVGKRERINIYVDDPDLRIQVKIAALQRGVTVSEYCLNAIRRAVDLDHVAGREAWREQALAAIERMKAIRERTLPLDVPISQLIHEGHDR
jgi:hypothetical protein